MNPLDRRRFLRSIMAGGGLAGSGLLGAGMGPQFAWGQRPVDPNEKTPDDLLTSDAKSAIDRGLKFLARRQNRSGQFAGAFGTSGYAAGTAVTGLGGLAFMCSGSVPGDGPYGRNVDACVEYLLRNTADTGYIAVPGGYDNMYGHGFATLFLSEAYGMSQNPDLRKKLEKSVELIVRCQNDAGGWRYQPQKSDADLSITICQIMALRAAREAGLNVPDETRKKCIEYVKRSQNSDGSFRYTLTGGSHGSFPLTAAGVVSLYSAGIYEGDTIEKALKWLETRGVQNSGSYYFYGQYYAVQAMWHAGGDYWAEWFPKIRNELVKTQSGGSWTDAQVGNEFGTAMALIILQMPLNYVPVFAA